MAADVAVIVDKGDFPGAVILLKYLERAWDAGKAGLQPDVAEHWHVLDKSIDHGLSALPTNTSNPTESKKAMTALLNTFYALQTNS